MLMPSLALPPPLGPEAEMTLPPFTGQRKDCWSADRRTGRDFAGSLALIFSISRGLPVHGFTLCAEATVDFCGCFAGAAISAFAIFCGAGTGAGSAFA